MDKIDRYQFLRNKSKRAIPSKRVPIYHNFDSENTWNEDSFYSESSLSDNSWYDPSWNESTFNNSRTIPKEKQSLHNMIMSKLISKDFWDAYLRNILIRTIIAVAILLVIQFWSLSKLRYKDIGLEKVKEAITYQLTWNKVKEVFETIDYDQIVEVWNEQGREQGSR